MKVEPAVLLVESEYSPLRMAKLLSERTALESYHFKGNPSVSEHLDQDVPIIRALHEDRLDVVIHVSVSMPSTAHTLSSEVVEKMQRHFGGFLNVMTQCRECIVPDPLVFFVMAQAESDPDGRSMAVIGREIFSVLKRRRPFFTFDLRYVAISDPLDLQGIFDQMDAWWVERRTRMLLGKQEEFAFVSSL
jgi:hypothetical protein